MSGIPDTARVLGTVALAFTVLGATGISDVKTLSSVVTALLALLAFSQIRSRRLTEQVRDANRGGPASFFAGEAEALWNNAAPHDLTVGDVETAGN